MANSFKYELVSSEVFTQIMNEYESLFYHESPKVNSDKFLTNGEKEILQKLNENFKIEYEMNLIIRTEMGEFVGWCNGCKSNRSTLTMHSSFVLPEYRRNGVYSRAIIETIHWAESKGFLTIESQHLVSNNNVIIPKLKSGFQINGIQVDDRFGLMVHLKLDLKQEIKEIHQVRIGIPTNDPRILDFFDI